MSSKSLEWWHKNKHLLKQDPKFVFARYKKSAKERGLAFELEFDAFVEIISKSCVYCGIAGAPYVGIDRIVNSKGYLEGNCAPCCRVCNNMKRDLPVEDFVSHCRRIAENLN